jgi:DNA-binding transcriptional LysR family regulator
MGVSRRRADWSDLRLFWAVAEAGGFGAAARALGVSQSTITRRIDELEYRLNARLLVRSPHGISLTEAGQRAFDRVLTMEHSAESLEREITNADDLPEGGVGLAAPDGVAGVLLPPHMPDFLRANPKIDLRLDCGLWPEHQVRGEADLWLTFTEPSGADLISRPLAHFHYGLFAARSYLDLYGEPTSVSEGLVHTYVHHVAQVHQPERWHPQADAFRKMVNFRIETNSSAVMVQAVRNGAGIGLMPTAILAVAPELVMLELPYMGSVKMWLCHHRDVARSARIRRVADWLEEVFDGKSRPWYREEFVHPRDFGQLTRAEPAASPANETGSKVALRARR